MLIMNGLAENAGLMRAAECLCVAARTAPEGKGKDLLVTAIVTEAEKECLQQQMSGRRTRRCRFLSRDEDNIDHAPVVVLIGTRKEPLQIAACGFCGFVDCDAMLCAGGTCSFNAGDLGIAVGSAVALAADLRIDNRIMYTAGKAAIELGILGGDVKIAYGIPLAAKVKIRFLIEADQG